MKLNERLLKVASLVPKNSIAIDVGCDHAYLPIYLTKNNLVKKIIASDNKEGPLLQAKKNIEKENLSKQIDVVLQDGIKELDKEIDTIIISGMGGLHMIGICKYLPDKMKQINTIILSPNNEVEKVRKEFTSLNFYIDKEILVKDNNHIYPVIRFKRGYKHYKKIDYLLGPILRTNKDKLFIELNNSEIKQKEILLSILPKKYWLRKLQLKKELKIRRKI